MTVYNKPCPICGRPFTAFAPWEAEIKRDRHVATVHPEGVKS